MGTTVQGSNAVDGTDSPEEETEPSASSGLVGDSRDIMYSVPLLGGLQCGSCIFFLLPGHFRCKESGTTSSDGDFVM